MNNYVNYNVNNKVGDEVIIYAYMFNLWKDVNSAVLTDFYL